MDRGNIYILMDQNIQENGMMINKMEKELKLGQMALDMKETIKWGKKMVNIFIIQEMEHFFGVIIHHLMENFKTITSMVKVSINGLMEEYLKEIGQIIKWMDMEYLLGVMEECN